MTDKAPETEVPMDWPRTRDPMEEPLRRPVLMTGARTFVSYPPRSLPPFPSILHRPRRKWLRNSLVVLSLSAMAGASGYFIGSRMDVAMKEPVTVISKKYPIDRVPQ